MKTLEYREVSLRSLRLPGEIREYLENTDPLLTDSIRALGMLHTPVIRKEDGRLVSGRKRLASALKLQEETVWIKYVECSDEEAELATLEENACRSHLSRQEQMDLITQIVDKRAKTIKPEDIPEGVKGRRRTPRGVARAQVAKQLGVRENTIAVAESRRRNQKPREKKERPAFELVSLGVEVDPALNGSAGRIAELLNHAARLVREARNQIQEIDTPLPKHSTQELHRQATELVQTLSALVPHSVCPYCKSIPEIRKDCDGCSTAGWVGKGQLAEVPPKLLDPDDTQVIFNGDMVPASSLLDMFDETEQESDDIDPGIFG